MRRRDLAKNKLNQAKSIALGPQRQVFKDFVNPQDKNDLFRFRASGSTNLQLKLRGLKENADLQVFTPKTSNRAVRRNIGKTDWSRLSGKDIRQFLTPVARSRKSGRKSEAIAVDVEPGIYYIRVSSRRQADTRYRLIGKAVDILSAPPSPTAPSNPTSPAPIPTSPSPATPGSITTTALYSGTGLPTDQGALTLGQVPIPSSEVPAELQPFLPFLPDSAADFITPTAFASQTSVPGGVVLDTRNASAADPNEGYAGYSNYTVDLSSVSLNDPTNITFSPVDVTFPVLDSAGGYSLTFDLAINAESSVADRAGFSLLVVGNDTRAIELDFKADRIFAQAAAFGAAETVLPSFNLANRNSYKLNVANGGYTLFGNGSPLLSGALRNYDFDPAASDPPLPANPYATPNFIFAGDLTDGGSSRTTLGPISLFT